MCYEQVKKTVLLRNDMFLREVNRELNDETFWKEKVDVEKMTSRKRRLLSILWVSSKATAR